MPNLFKPRLSGDNSIIASLAAVAIVIAIYQAKVGPVSDVHATDAGDGNMAASIRKAGWESLAVVSAVALLAGDLHIVILGGATVIAEEFAYRHANMTNPSTGKIQLTPQAYQPAGGQAPAPAAG